MWIFHTNSWSTSKESANAYNMVRVRTEPQAPSAGCDGWTGWQCGDYGLLWVWGSWARGNKSRDILGLGILSPACVLSTCLPTPPPEHRLGKDVCVCPVLGVVRLESGPSHPLIMSGCLMGQSSLAASSAGPVCLPWPSVFSLQLALFFGPREQRVPSIRMQDIFWLRVLVST